MKYSLKWLNTQQTRVRIENAFLFWHYFTCHEQGWKKLALLEGGLFNFNSCKLTENVLNNQSDGLLHSFKSNWFLQDKMRMSEISLRNHLSKNEKCWVTIPSFWSCQLGCCYYQKLHLSHTRFHLIQWQQVTVQG